jgi:hypothetical protein
MAIGFSRWKWNFKKQASGSVPTANGGGERMLLYEMLIAIGIAVVLVVAAIDRLAARVMMGPEEEMALLRLARAAPAQRRLVAYWTHALAAPLPARLATLITQLETQDVSA